MDGPGSHRARKPAGGIDAVPDRHGTLDLIFAIYLANPLFRKTQKT